MTYNLRGLNACDLNNKGGLIYSLDIRCVLAYKLDSRTTAVSNSVK
jgi:hypothetical protein